jgi:CheY-like chemotaxis protein
MALVLVIDDDPMVRRAIGYALEAAGHRVLQAADGRAGLQMFRTHGADIVITDIIMPEVEGIETIRELRRAAPKLRIIAISGSMPIGAPSWLDIAGHLGADAALAKPFTAAELLTAVTPDAAGDTAQTPKPQDEVHSILVVDDDEEALAYVGDLLTEHGYDVIAAASAPAALSVIASGRKIDLLLTDVRMPGPRDGFDLARAAKDRLPGLSVVYISGWVETLPPLDDYVLGPLLTKPFRAEMLVRAVQQSLSRA